MCATVQICERLDLQMKCYDWCLLRCRYEKVREYFREDAKQRKGPKAVPAAYAASMRRSMLSWV